MAAVVAAALLVVVLAAWAATTGPSGVLTGDGFDPAGEPSAEPSATATADGGPPPEAASPPEVEVREWVGVVALVLQVAVTLLAVYLLVRHAGLPLARWLRARLGRRRGGRLEEAAAEGFPVLEPPAAVARELAAGASAQRALLLDEHATPRNAVVACWQRFEAQAQAAGVGRRPWETSSEYTMRVLDLVDAHGPAVSRLASLYREARFSEHELTEQHRSDAVAALDEIHRTLGISV